MLQQEFATIPAVDVLDGRAVRLLRGDYDRVELEAGDPLALVRRAAATAPPFVHVVALGAARDGGVPLELARSVVDAAGGVPVQLGGGVRSPDDVPALLAAGVARVVIGTAAFGRTPLREFVSDRVAVAIDVAAGIVRTDGWRESTTLTTLRALERCTEAGVATVVCTAIERDGTRSGPDLELLREVRAHFDGCILAAGGIRDAADVSAVRELGIDGVVVGRAWLEGAIRGSEPRAAGTDQAMSNEKKQDKEPEADVLPKREVMSLISPGATSVPGLGGLLGSDPIAASPPTMDAQHPIVADQPADTSQPTESSQPTDASFSSTHTTSSET